MTADGEIVSGTLSGSRIIGTTTIVTSDGVATGNFAGAVAVDGNSATASDAWVFTGSGASCTGTSQLVAMRLTSYFDSGGQGTGGRLDSGDQGTGGRFDTGGQGTGGRLDSGWSGGSSVDGGESRDVRAADGGDASDALGMGGSGGSLGTLDASAESGHADASTSLCSLVGFYAAPNAKHVVVNGTYAYVAEGNFGIEILDISNPAQPSVVGMLPTTNATRLAIYGNDLYVADGSGGLKVIDISDPTSPLLVSTPTLPDAGLAELRTLTLNGTRLYAAYLSLDVFDLTGTPAMPVGRGSLRTTFIEDMAVDGTLIYAATANGLEIFSVLAPAGPFLAGSYESNDFGQAIALAPGYAFYGGQSGLTVFDISTPSIPSVAASSGAVSSINGLTLQGSYLYVSAQGPGLTMMDISDPKIPKVVGRCGESSVNTPQSMTIAGKYGFVAAGSGGVVILKLSPTEQGDAGTGGAMDVSQIGDAGGTTEGSDGGVDGGFTGTRGSCSLVGFYPAASANHVITSGTHAYVAEGSAGIEVLDISNPALPSAVGALPTTNAIRLAISGGDLYVADGSGGLKVIDVSNPASPHLINTPTLPGSGPVEVDTLALSGASLYVADLGLDIFDLTKPNAPVAKGSLSRTFIQDLAVEGTLVYAATANGLDVFNVLSPTSPLMAGSYTNNDWGQAIALAPGYAFYGGQSGLTVFDISTPSTPSIAASSGAAGSINGLTLHGNYLYVSA
ncbi:MAG TPA: hypothetical protein VIM14_15580, partial [Polyangia bacterium]